MQDCRVTSSLTLAVYAVVAVQCVSLVTVSCDECCDPQVRLHPVAHGSNILLEARIESHDSNALRMLSFVNAAVQKFISVFGVLPPLWLGPPFLV